MRFEHEKLEPFELMVSQISHLIFDYGLSSIIAEGLLRDPSELKNALDRSPSTFRRFIRACHYGYDLAQRRLVSAVTEYENQVRGLEGQVKEHRRNRDKAAAAAALELIRCLQDRQIVLRRLADSVLYVLVSGKNWILRRMSLHDQIPRIDPTTLGRTCEIATELNRENRLTFNLISDLTTCVHIGDLVEISFEAGRSAQWRIIELKEGRVNEKLQGKVQELSESASAGEVEDAVTNLDQKSAAQLKRMIRQRQRENQFNQIVNTDEGTDPRTQTEIRLTETVFVDDYFEAIRHCLGTLEREPIAAASLRGGFTVVAARGQLLERFGEAPIAHVLYHLRHPGQQCRLFSEDEAELRGEVSAMASIPPFYDLVETNLHAQWPPPLFYWPVPNLHRMNLLFGRTKLFGQLDWAEFFQFASDSGIELTWARDSDLREMREIADILPGSPNARAVEARSRTRDDSGALAHYLSGFFARMFLEFMVPRQILEIMHRDLETLRLTAPLKGTPRP